MRKILILLLFLFLFLSTIILAAISHAETSSSSISWLSRRAGDARYCMLYGDCVVNSLNVTLLNVINKTISDLNVTGDIYNIPYNIYTNTMHSSNLYLSGNYINKTNGFSIYLLNDDANYNYLYLGESEIKNLYLGYNKEASPTGARAYMGANVADWYIYTGKSTLLQSNADMDDFINISTINNIPTISTEGNSNLKLSASSNTVEVDDNLKVNGIIDNGNLYLAGNYINSNGDINFNSSDAYTFEEGGGGFFVNDYTQFFGDTNTIHGDTQIDSLKDLNITSNSLGHFRTDCNGAICNMTWFTNLFYGILPNYVRFVDHEPTTTPDALRLENVYLDFFTTFNGITLFQANPSGMSLYGLNDTLGSASIFFINGYVEKGTNKNRWSIGQCAQSSSDLCFKKLDGPPYNLLTLDYDDYLTRTTTDLLVGTSTNYGDGNDLSVADDVFIVDRLKIFLGSNNLDNGTKISAFDDSSTNIGNTQGAFYFGDSRANNDDYGWGMIIEKLRSSGGSGSQYGSNLLLTIEDEVIGNTAFIAGINQSINKKGGVTMFNITREGDMELYNDLSIGGDATIDGQLLANTIKSNFLTLLSNLYVNGDTSMGGNLEVNGTTTFNDEVDGSTTSATFGTLNSFYSHVFTLLNTTYLLVRSSAVINDDLEVGEDLIVNESATIADNLTVAGNFTGNQIYGEMWNRTGSASPYTITIGAVGTYYNVTGLKAGELNGFEVYENSSSQGGSYLMAKVGGRYLASATLSTKIGVASGDLYGYAISHEFERANHNNCYARRAAVNSFGNVGITCLMDIEANTRINLQIEQETGGVARDVDITTANLNLVRIGDII